MTGLREGGDIIADAGRGAATGVGRAFRLFLLLPLLGLFLLQQALDLTGGSLVAAYAALLGFALLAWHGVIGREFRHRARRRAARLNAIEEIRRPL